MLDFYDRYMILLEEDRKITHQMVEDGELTEDEGIFRDEMRKDEILDSMDED
jgi:hypothetical protein